MPIQRDSRSGQDRRKFDLSSVRNIEKERRWNKDPRGSMVDDADELYDSELGDLGSAIEEAAEAERDD